MKRCLVALTTVLAACGSSKPAPAPVANHPETTEKMPAEPDAEEQARRAQAEAAEAARLANEASARVDQIQRELEDLNGKLDTSVGDVANANSDAERAAAKARLVELQRQQAEMKARVQAAMDAAMKAQRAKGVKIPQECIDNPLAKGCS